MDKPKHTPGPWGIGGSIVASLEGETVARILRRPAIYGGKRYDCNDTDPQAPKNGAIADANAHLIAAAPELLDALRETLRALEYHLDESCRDHNLKHRDLLCPCNQNEAQRARLAIHKATGEE